MLKQPPLLGLCQWFNYEDYHSVERAVTLMHDLGVRQLRTGISWADYCRPRGKAWYDWQMRTLKEFELLVSIWHTPPSIAEGAVCNGPPLNLYDYGGFVGQMIEQYGDTFSHVELWNEPNNRYKWDFTKFDPDWAKFGLMIRHAAWVAAKYGMPTVLGGMIPVDHHWLQLMQSYQALEQIDVIAIHAFPEMWWPDRPNWEWYQCWKGWNQKISDIAEFTQKPIWVTETGLATWDMTHLQRGRYDLQSLKLAEAALAPAERVYWYSLIDLDPHRDAIEGFHVDENEYHMGLVTHDGEKKSAYEKMKQLMHHAADVPHPRHKPATVKR